MTVNGLTKANPINTPILYNHESSGRHINFLTVDPSRYGWNNGFCDSYLVVSKDNNLSQPNCSGAAARGSASDHFQLDNKSPNIGNSMFSASEMTQSDTISCIAGITQTNPGSVYRLSHGTAKMTLTSSQLPKRLEGPSTRYVPEWPSSGASKASDGFHQTCIMSPSLYTGGTPLVTNFPMSEHSSQLVAIGQSLPLLPQKLVQQI